MSLELALGESVSRETRERLAIYLELLEKWNGAINLVSPRSLLSSAARHFEDSAQLWPLCPSSALHWADLGTGGGFPGLVIALLAAERAPGMRVSLVESDGRKAAFLATVARETGIAPAIIVARIEAIPPLSADVVSARALAPLPHLLDLCARHLGPGGIMLLPKGRAAMTEVDEALVSWRFSVQNIPSRTDPDGLILKLGDLSRA